jgi:hypothetical protein
MLQTIWTRVKSVWATVAPFLLVFLAAIFMLEKHEKDGDDEKLLNARTDAEDAALKAQGDALAADSAKTEADAAKAKATPMTEQETLDFLNKKDI